MLVDARRALHAHTCRVGRRTRHSRAISKVARHAVQGCVHGWESMGRLLRPGMCAKITHIELRIEHRAPRLLPARCDADAWSCLDFQALGRRRGHDDPCVDGGSAMYGIRIVCRALQERTRPNRHPGYGKPAPDIATKSSDEICVDQGGAAGSTVRLRGLHVKCWYNTTVHTQSESPASWRCQRDGGGLSNAMHRERTHNRARGGERSGSSRLRRACSADAT